MKKSFITATKKGQTIAHSTLGSVEGIVSKTTTTVDSYIAPVRTSVLKRYPVLFSLLVTFGVAMTFLGFEKIVTQIAFLDNNPFILLIVGITILALTGTLYKKLNTSI
jgi:uncharacterized integral membrane protein